MQWWDVGILRMLWRICAFARISEHITAASRTLPLSPSVFADAMLNVLLPANPGESRPSVWFPQMHQAPSGCAATALPGCAHEFFAFAGTVPWFHSASVPSQDLHPASPSIKRGGAKGVRKWPVRRSAGFLGVALHAIRHSTQINEGQRGF